MHEQTNEPHRTHIPTGEHPAPPDERRRSPTAQRQAAGWASRPARRSRLWAVGAGGLALAVLTGCGGSVGAQRSGDGSGEGYAPRASTEDIADALADMHETTLTYQPPASGPNDLNYYREQNFKDSIEELSGGKITVEIVHSQAVAPYTEVTDALADGRLDLAFVLPQTVPEEFPVAQALIAGTALAGTSPLVGELASNAALTEVAWNTSELIEEYEEHGLSVLMPLNPAGSVFAMCGDPIDGDEPLGGRQVNTAASISASQVEALGATPTSITYTETYEAIQRGTIDCTMSALLPSVPWGYIEVASDLAYSTEAGFARGAGALMGGMGFQQLPLAAQQLVYDQMGNWFRDSRRSDLDGAYEAITMLHENDGTISELSDVSAEALRESAMTVIDEYVEDGLVQETFAVDIEEAIGRWAEVVEELGYEDEGGFENFDDWYEPDEVEFIQPLSDRVVEEILTEHRPQ